MNRKGFTLIEVLAVIVLVGIVLGIIIVPNVLEDYNDSKNNAYDMLINNIKTASENYYMECEYGGLVNCSLTGNYIEVSLKELVQNGFLTVTSDAGEKKVIDPRNNNDISECKIKIEKSVVGDNYKVTYNLTLADGESAYCPFNDGD